jgi:L-lactate dehydrogenase
MLSWMTHAKSCLSAHVAVRGIHGIENDVFLSMPCGIGAHGVRRVIDLPLTGLEKDQLKHSAKTVWDIQKDVWDSI